VDVPEETVEGSPDVQGVETGKEPEKTVEQGSLVLTKVSVGKYKK